MADMKEKDIPTLKQLTDEYKRIKYKKDFRKLFFGTFSSIVVVAAIAVLISVVTLPVLRVTGSSMNPNFSNDDLVICSKRTALECGDIVAFYFNNKILVKRVIGIPGDVIDIKEDGTVLVNGRELDEPYVAQKALGECNITMPYRVPENRVFVMGDQRETSIDSRSTTVGSVSYEYIIGKVVLRIWPFDRIETVG